MSHLSQFSYPNRFFLMLLSLIFFFTYSTHVFNYNYFTELIKWKWNVKLYAYTLVAIMCLTWIVYDFLISLVAYVDLSEHTNVVLKEIADVLLNVAFASLTSCVFVLIAFFRGIVQQMTNNGEKFMGNFEFKAFLIYSLVTPPIYFVLQYTVRFLSPDDVSDNGLFVIIPQFIFSMEIFISSILLVTVTAPRIKQQVIDLEVKNERAIVVLNRIRKLIYILVACNMSCASSIAILNIFYATCIKSENVAVCFHASYASLMIDSLTSIFSISFPCIVITIMYILNAGRYNRYRIPNKGYNVSSGNINNSSLSSNNSSMTSVVTNIRFSPGNKLGGGSRKQSAQGVGHVGSMVRPKSHHDGSSKTKLCHMNGMSSKISDGGVSDSKSATNLIRRSSESQSNVTSDTCLINNNFCDDSMSQTSLSIADLIAESIRRDSYQHGDSRNTSDINKRNSSNSSNSSSSSKSNNNSNDDSAHESVIDMFMADQEKQEQEQQQQQQQEQEQEQQQQDITDAYSLTEALNRSFKNPGSAGSITSRISSSSSSRHSYTDSQKSLSPSNSFSSSSGKPSGKPSKTGKSLTSLFGSGKSDNDNGSQSLNDIDRSSRTKYLTVQERIAQTIEKLEQQSHTGTADNDLGFMDHDALPNVLTM